MTTSDVGGWTGDPEHSYGTDTDCACGRNFATVRGLREHLTKARGPVGVVHPARTIRICDELEGKTND